MVKYLTTYKILIITIIALGMCTMYYFIDPCRYKLIPKCPIKLMTTLDCPGCGFQRALHAFLHGNFIEAIHYNLFLLFAIPLTCIWYVNSIIIEHTSRQACKILLLKLNSRIIYIYIFCYVCWFVVRNIIYN